MRLRDACGVWVILSLAGCGEGPPPLDELPLRDTLRADPEVVGALSDDARARLAARLDVARARDGVTDDVAGAGDDPAGLAAAVDRARVARNTEPLIVGAISAGVARPVTDRADGGDAPTFPPLEDGVGPPTADAEQAALAGEAGAMVRALMRASGASRLRRVTGWPTGALAVGDTVYVNAAWLVALAPGGGGHPDAGARAAPGVSASAAGASAGGAAQAAATAAPDQERSALTSGSTGSEDPDGGAPRPPPTPPPPWPPEPPPDDGTSDGETCGSSLDACDACDACAAGSSSCEDDGSSDSCDDTSDDGSSGSCDSTTDDGSSDSCGGTTDDGAASGCQITGARPRCRRGRPRRGSGTTEAWLLMPFGFLMFGQRKRGP